MVATGSDSLRKARVIAEFRHVYRVPLPTSLSDKPVLHMCTDTHTISHVEN